MYGVDRLSSRFWRVCLAIKSGLEGKRWKEIVIFDTLARNDSRLLQVVFCIVQIISYLNASSFYSH